MRGVTAAPSQRLVPAGALDLADENERLEGVAPEERLAFAARQFGADLLFTSSFGAQSAVLLHLWSVVCRELPVTFIDTGFLFPETLAYRDRLAARLGLDVRVPTSDAPPEEQPPRMRSPPPRPAAWRAWCTMAGAGPVVPTSMASPRSASVTRGPARNTRDSIRTGERARATRPEPRPASSGACVRLAITPTRSTPAGSLLPPRAMPVAAVAATPASPARKARRSIS